MWEKEKKEKKKKKERNILRQCYNGPATARPLKMKCIPVGR